MTQAESPIRNISDTALWTAAYRAKESARRNAIFHDPFAARLAGDRGPQIVRAIKRPAVRYGVVLRTAAIDEMLSAALAEHRCDAVLNLAAGLDARAYRMELPPELHWIDVDMPELLDYKDAILSAETPRCQHEEVRLDLADRSARVALFERIGREHERVLVLTEGLLSYLEPDAVADLARDLHQQPAFAEWIMDITGSQISANVKTAGEEIRPSDARTRFTPAENTGFFLPYGWVEAQYVDLFLESGRLGLDSLLGRVLRTFLPIIPRGVRANLERALGIARLGRAPSA